MKNQEKDKSIRWLYKYTQPLTLDVLIEISNKYKSIKKHTERLLTSVYC
jgi:hypothetical protein